MKKIAIFASGSGSNAENIIQYFAQKPQFCVKSVFCNVPDAYVLERAKKYRIPSFVFNREEFRNPDKVFRQLQEQEPQHRACQQRCQHEVRRRECGIPGRNRVHVVRHGRARDKRDSCQTGQRQPWLRHGIGKALLERHHPVRTYQEKERDSAQNLVGQRRAADAREHVQRVRGRSEVRSRGDEPDQNHAERQRDHAVDAH